MARITGMIHHARLGNSPRLKKLLAELSSMEWLSTAHLTHNCNNYAVGTSISELRSNGIAVQCRRVKMDSGERWFEYRLGRG